MTNLEQKLKRAIELGVFSRQETILIRTAVVDWHYDNHRYANRETKRLLEHLQDEAPE